MEFIFLLLPIVTAVAGSYLTYYFTTKSKKTEAILKFKEERYLNLLVLLQGFVGSTASAETKRQFFEEQYRSWLYASDNVVRAVNEMVELVISSKGRDPDAKKGRIAVGKIVLEIRKDLLGKSALSPIDFRYTDVIDTTHNRKARRNGR